MLPNISLLLPTQTLYVPFPLSLYQETIELSCCAETSHLVDSIAISSADNAWL